MMLALAALFAAAAPAAAQPGCADHWTVEIDRESFIHNGTDRTFTPAQLAEFRNRVGSALKGAIAEACRRDKAKPSLAGGIRRVKVFSASGMTEAELSPIPDEPRTLGFYWVFSEENLALPPRQEILEGLTCWVDPRAKICLENND